MSARCRCGVALPAVAYTETPFEFCSKECYRESTAPHADRAEAIYAYTDVAGEHWLVLGPAGYSFAPLADTSERFEVRGEVNAVCFQAFANQLTLVRVRV